VKPSGGTAIWVTTADVSTTARWAARARRLGVILGQGRAFTLQGRSSAGARLGFADLTEDEIGTAVRRLVAASRA
jgi:DNA-binding transcriptional MocR family regulator